MSLSNPHCKRFDRLTTGKSIRSILISQHATTPWPGEIVLVPNIVEKPVPSFIETWKRTFGTASYFVVLHYHILNFRLDPAPNSAEISNYIHPGIMRNRNRPVFTGVTNSREERHQSTSLRKSLLHRTSGRTQLKDLLLSFSNDKI